MKRRNVLGGLAAGGAGLMGAASLAGAAQTPGGNPEPQLPAIKTRWAFSVSVFFDERIRIESQGGRAFVPAVGGEIWGPRLSGIVVPYGGADYGGGGGPLDAHYMFQADDGHLIYINNRGFMKALGEVPGGLRQRGQAREGEPFSQRMGGASLADVPLRMRSAPFFDAPKDSPHAWMSSTLFVGHGARHVNPDHTIFTYYEVL